MLRVLHVAGARPNFIKIAPLMAALREHSEIEQRLVHTGQHYDERLSKVFFDDLQIDRPNVNLEVGSGSHAVQTARIMMAFEGVCVEWQPDLVVVVGDVNSTVACALVGAKLGIAIAHVEAGLRSFDWTMPEEINRVVTDRLADVLFTTEQSANENLRREGVPSERIHFVGNVMVDTLLRYREQARSLQVPERLGVVPKEFALVTLHRPANVDSGEALAGILEGICQVAKIMPVLFPIHPRTKGRIDSLGLQDQLGGTRTLEPLGYLEFLGLMNDAAVVLTDSGGIQEETTVLGVPCLTLRPNTERPVTVEQGSNTLVRLDPGAIVTAVERAVDGSAAGNRGPHQIPELWDGKAAVRIARIINDRSWGPVYSPIVPQR